jgi:hypothetical protein
MDVPQDSKNSPTFADSWILSSVLTRVIVWGSAALAMVIFCYVGNWFSVPYLRGYSASLFEGSAVANVLVIAVVYLAIVAVASILAGSFKPGLGVFAASFGLAAISTQGGTASALLRSSGGSSRVYVMLLMETGILAALVATGAAVQALLVRKPEIQEIKDEDEQPDLMSKLMSVAVQAGVTVVLTWLLAASDSKGQALAAVGFASLAGTLLADNALPVGLTPLAVIAPFVAAAIGYTWAIFNAAGTEPANPLAAALPLDYASFGVAGAMLAHWVSQQWRDEAEEE